MLIPNKFSGFHNGVRRCFGGGGGGGGGDGAGDGVGDGTGPGPGPGVGNTAGENTANTSTNTNTANTGNTVFNTNRGSVTGMNFTGGNTATGTTTIPSDNLNLRNMAGKPYNQSGPQYNALLQQGYTGNDIRNALTTQGRPVSDSDYGFLVQNAAMTSPTGRPFAGSDQFFQPVYNTSYMNYARPTTQFDTSTYGTQPVYSPARAYNDRNSGSAAAGQRVVNNAINTFFNQNPNSDINSTLAAMRGVGINRTDIQAAGGYNNYGPQMTMPSMQTQARQPFNPFTNNSGYGRGLDTAGYGGFGSPMGGLSPFVTGQMPQMQSPFSYNQPAFQPQYNPYQTQTPFSFQQPLPPPNYGPSQPIVSRSSQMRGRPNVMRRAEGGIASLLEKDQ